MKSYTNKLATQLSVMKFQYQNELCHVERAVGSCEHITADFNRNSHDFRKISVKLHKKSVTLQPF